MSFVWCTQKYCLSFLLFVLGSCNSTASPLYAELRHIVLWILQFSSQSLVCWTKTYSPPDPAIQEQVLGILYSNKLSMDPATQQPVLSMLYSNILSLNPTIQQPVLGMLNFNILSLDLQLSSQSLVCFTHSYCPRILPFSSQSLVCCSQSLTNSPEDSAFNRGPWYPVLILILSILYSKI